MKKSDMTSSWWEQVPAMSFQASAASWSAYAVATSGRMVPSSSSCAILPSTSPDGASLIISPDTWCLVVSSCDYGLGGRNEMAAILQDDERRLLCIATNQVEDYIDLVSQNLLELLLAIIDDPAGSDGLDYASSSALAVAMTVAPGCDANCTA
jgi:hypothetical protein